MWSSTLKKSERRRDNDYLAGSPFFLPISSGGGGHITATIWCFDKLRNEFDELAIKIGKRLSAKSSVILRAAMHVYRCPNGVYETFSTS